MVNRAEQPFGHDGAGNNLAYFGGQERLKRREFLQKIAAGACIAATGIFTTKQYALPYATEKYQEIHDKYSSLGGPYTARAVVSEMGGREIDSEMLDELLGNDAAEIGGASLSVVTKEFQESPEAIAEYDLVLERDGPVFAKFDGLQGDDVSLTILRAVVDDEEEFLIPLVRDEAEQPSITVQLGVLLNTTLLSVSSSAAKKSSGVNIPTAFSRASFRQAIPVRSVSFSAPNTTWRFSGVMTSSPSGL